MKCRFFPLRSCPLGFVLRWVGLLLFFSWYSPQAAERLRFDQSLGGAFEGWKVQPPLSEAGTCRLGRVFLDQEQKAAPESEGAAAFEFADAAAKGEYRFLFNNPLPVSEGKKYRVVLYSRASGSDFRVEGEVKLKGTDKRQPSRVVSWEMVPSESWDRKEITFEAQSGEMTCVLVVRINRRQNALGTVWLDQVKMDEAGSNNP